MMTEEEFEAAGQEWRERTGKNAFYLLPAADVAEANAATPGRYVVVDDAEFEAAVRAHLDSDQTSVETILVAE